MNRNDPTPALLRSVLAGLLPLLLACAGAGGDPPPGPPELTYRNPAGDGWRLLANPAASTPTHLVLDLVPPAQEPGGRGVALELECGAPGVTWAPVAPGDPQLARNGGVYDLGARNPVLLGRTRAGRLLAATLQKGRARSAAYGARPVLSIALDLDPAAPRGKVPLKVLKAYHQPPQGPPVAITAQVRVGRLRVGDPATPGPAGPPGRE